MPALLLAAAVGLSLCVSARADEADDDFAVATGHYAQQRWQFAGAAFAAFLQRYPEHAKANQARFLWGETLLQNGLAAEAYKQFDLYLAAEVQGQYARTALFRLGESAYLANQFEAAATALAQFRAKYPNDSFNAYVLPYLGNIALTKNDAATGARHFRAGLAQYPDGPLQDDCRFGLARALVAEGKKDEGERLLTALAGKLSSPLVDQAQFELGALYYAAGEFGQAAETLAAFDTRWPDSPLRGQARLGRGWALYKAKQFPEARAAFEALVDEPKIGLTARYWLGMTYKAEENWRRAAATFESVAATDAKDPLALEAHCQAGEALLRAGDTAAAAAQFETVIARGNQKNSCFDAAILGAARTALETHSHETVDRLASEFRGLCPQSARFDDMARLHARSLLERNRHEEAEKLLKELITNNVAQFDAPSSGASPRVRLVTRGDRTLADRYLLAVALEGLKQYDEALTTLAPVLDASDPQLMADAQLRQASLLVALKRYRAAIAPLQAYLATEPTDDGAVKARGELALVFARTGQMERARQTYTALIESHGEHKLVVAITEQLAEVAYEAKDTEFAGQLFARLQQLGQRETVRPDQPDDTQTKALSGLGWTQFKAGRYAEAEETFDQLLKERPTAAIEAEAAFVRGQALDRLNRPDAALAMYDLVIDRHAASPQHAPALLEGARLRVRLQQNSAAAALYEKLATQYPKFAKLDAALYEWAWVLRDLKRFNEEEQLFERVRDDFPRSRFAADAAYRLAQRAYAAKDYGRAKTLLAAALDAEPEDRLRQFAQLLQGQISIAEEDWQAVQSTFESLAKQTQGDDCLLAEYWVAESYYRREQYDVAAQHFAALAERAKEKRDAWLGMIPLRRAQILARSRQWAEARQMAESIATDFPAFDLQYEADYLVGRCLHAQAELDAAREAFARVIRSPNGAKTETAAMAQFAVGETYFHQKKYDAALKEYLRLEILYAFPAWQAAALFEAARCQEEMKDAKEAAVLYNRLVQNYPSTRFAAEAKQRLAK